MINDATVSRNKPSVATLSNFTYGHISAARIYRDRYLYKFGRLSRRGEKLNTEY